MTLRDRFESKFIRGAPDECWEWTAAKRNGYGALRVNGKTQYAHRLSWELANGHIPSGHGYHGTVIRHICDNKLCVNPKHLIEGTQIDNIKDAMTRGRIRTHEDHGMSKFSNEEINAIRKLKGTMLQKQIALLCGVSEAHVSLILRGLVRR